MKGTFDQKKIKYFVGDGENSCLLARAVVLLFLRADSNLLKIADSLICEG
jgi:hypothetical protein